MQINVKCQTMMMSCVCRCCSGAVRSTGRVVHEARPGAECGERPPGGVGRSSPLGAQHVQRRRSRVAAGSAGAEEDNERGGGEEVESMTLGKIRMGRTRLSKGLPLQHLR